MITPGNPSIPPGPAGAWPPPQGSVPDQQAYSASSRTPQYSGQPQYQGQPPYSGQGPQSGRGGGRAQWVALALVLLAGIGVGGYFLVSNSGGDKKPTKEAGPTSGDTAGPTSGRTAATASGCPDLQGVTVGQPGETTFHLTRRRRNRRASNCRRNNDPSSATARSAPGTSRVTAAEGSANGASSASVPGATVAQYRTQLEALGYHCSVHTVVDCQLVDQLKRRVFFERDGALVIVVIGE